MDRTVVVLLGIHLSLVGGVLLGSATGNVGGVGLVLLLGGLVVSLVGVVRPEPRDAGG